MVNLAKVYIWGEYAGAVLWNENTGSATFEYEPSFARKGWDLSWSDRSSANAPFP